MQSLVCIFFWSFYLSFHQILATSESVVEDPFAAYANDEEWRTKCKPIGHQCATSNDCCVGVCNMAKNCESGFMAVNSRTLGKSVDPSKAIAEELHPGETVDVRNHKNIDLLPPPSVCGLSFEKKGRKKRIVGGLPVEPGEAPWMAQIYLHNNTYATAKFHCGGTIINARYILTAAHCLTRIKTDESLKQITVGHPDRRQGIDCDSMKRGCKLAMALDVEEIIVHERYAEGNLKNDIGLIRLKHPIIFDDWAYPICLPLSDEYISNWQDPEMLVLGWGVQNKPTDSGPKKISWVQQKVKTDLVIRDNCDRFFTRHIGNLDRKQICAGGNPDQGDCQGDSGGPVLKRFNIENETRAVQYGIVSTGTVSDCGAQGQPSVYTNVIYFMPWILDNIVPPDKTLTSLFNKSEEVDPQAELKTDKNVDLTEHPKIHLLPSYEQCGISKESTLIYTPPPQATERRRKKRIAGGLPLGSPTILPWMAQIYVRNGVNLEVQLMCTGVIINERYILTQATCVAGLSSPFILDSVVLGNYNRLSAEECIENFCKIPVNTRIEEVKVHESFTRYSRENDIALLRIPRQTFDEFIQPICLPRSEDIIKYWTTNKYTTAGWGVSTAGGLMSSILTSVNLPLQERESCNSVHSRQYGVLDRSRLCGGGVAGKGQCVGDGGAPMMKQLTINESDTEMERYFAFGVVSVYQCGAQGSPNIYTNVLYHMDWILANIEP